MTTPEHSASTPSRAPTSAIAPRRSRGRRWARWALIGSAVLVGGWLLATRSFVTRLIGQSIASSKLGVPVKARSITLSEDGRIIVRGLEILSEGDAGRTAPFAVASEVVIRVPWWRGLWGGSTPAESVTVDGFRIRVSQSVVDGSPNIPAFRISGGSGGSGALPVVQIRDGVVELGEHDATGFRPLRQLSVKGQLTPGQREGSYVFDLRDAAPAAGAEALSLTGEFDETKVSARLSGLKLDTITPDAAPTPLRELFRKLDLAGRISATTFEYSIPPAGAPASARMRGIDAALELDGVAVTLPFEDLSSGAPAGERYPRLKAVSGKIVVKNGEPEATLAGMLEDLPVNVTLRWHGPSLSAPFDAVVVTPGFRLQPNARLLPFMPPVVHQRLSMFSNPSGIVDSRIVVTRAKAGEAPSVSGTFEFKEGVASFHRFPYEFREMAGLFEFDESKLQIVRLRGRAANGATISTRGLITPLTDEASVKLDIEVDNIPVDESLAAGLGPRRRHVLEALFNRERQEELIKAGLIVTPAEGAKRANEVSAAKERLTRLESRGDVARSVLDAARREVLLAEKRAETPTFEIGGVGRAKLSLETPFGRDMPWTQIIEIEIPRAGLLPKKFPLPIVAKDVKLLVDDTVLSVEGGIFGALRGGEATVHARADFTSAPTVPDEGAAPKQAQRETDITITAKGIPFDDLLINAIPAKGNSFGAGDDRRTLGQVLEELHLTGAGDASVWIGDVAPDEIGFKAKVSFKDATCSPQVAGEPMLEKVGGSLEVDDASLRLSIAGEIPAAHAGAGTEASGTGGHLSADLTAAFRAGAAPTFDTRVAIGELDTRTPVERAIGVFAPRAARTVRELRERYKPSGVVDVSTRVADDGKAPLVVEVETTSGRNIEFTYAPMMPAGAAAMEPTRVGMGPWSGGLKYAAGTPDTIEFKGLRSAITSGGKASGEAKLQGTVELADGLDAGSLSLELSGARFEAPIVRTVMAERLSAEFASFMAERNPRGEFDLTMKLDRPGARARGRSETPWEVQGELHPRSLAIHGGTVDVECPHASGLLRFSRRSGVFESLALDGVGWRVGLGGGWELMDNGSSTLQATIQGSSEGLAPGLMSLMPETVRDLSTALAAKAEGPVTFRDVDLQLQWLPAGAQGPSPAFKVSGLFGFASAEADVGVVVSDAKGDVKFTASRDVSGKVDYQAWASLGSARAAGVRITETSAMLKSGQNPGETLAPNIEGHCHGGSFAIEASLKPVDPLAPDGEKAFVSEAQLAGIGLAGVINDLSAKRDQDETRSATIDGSVSLGGIAGNPASRRGRGEITMGGGAVIEMPVLLMMIQASNFQIPVGERLDTALASFYVEGPVVAVDRLSVLSSSVELRGFGTVTWPDLDLNLVFNSRSISRIPMIHTIIEKFRDELVTTVVRGTAREPKISVEPFRTARGTLSGVFRDKTEADLMMSGLEARSNEAAERRRLAPPARFEGSDTERGD